MSTKLQGDTCTGFQHRGFEREANRLSKSNVVTQQLTSVLKGPPSKRKNKWRTLQRRVGDHGQGFASVRRDGQGQHTHLSLGDESGPHVLSIMDLRGVFSLGRKIMEKIE